MSYQQQQQQQPHRHSPPTPSALRPSTDSSSHYSHTSVSQQSQSQSQSQSQTQFQSQSHSQAHSHTSNSNSTSHTSSVFPASDPSDPYSSRPSTTNSNANSNMHSDEAQEIEFPSSGLGGAGGIDLASPTSVSRGLSRSTGGSSNAGVGSAGGGIGGGGLGGQGHGQGGSGQAIGGVGGGYAQQRTYTNSAPSTPRLREDAALLSPSSSSSQQGSQAQQQQSFMEFGQHQQPHQRPAPQGRSGSSPLGLANNTGTASSQASAATGNPFASRPASRSSSTNKFTTYAHPNPASSHPTSPTNAGFAPHTPSTSTSPPLSPGLSPQNNPSIIAGLGLGAGAHTSAFPASGFGSVGGRGGGSMVLYRLSGVPSEYSASGVAPPSGAGGVGAGGGVPPLPTSTTGQSGMSGFSALSGASSGSQHALLPPTRSFHGFGAGHSNRDSIASSSGDSIISLDSKYPAFPPSSSSPHNPNSGASSPFSLAALGAGIGIGGTGRSGTGSSASGSVRGLVPYAYNPLEDDDGDDDEVDWLHDPDAGYPKEKSSSSTPSSAPGSRLNPAVTGAAAAAAAAASSKLRSAKNKIRPPPGTPGAPTKTFPLRGVLNVGVLLLLILALLCLFILYPVLVFFRDERFTQGVVGNVRINGTGQAPVLFQMPELIDAETPESAKTRTGFDGKEYELVFSDEFNTPGRTFYPGDDPFWEAVDLWYGATQDLEWYDPAQVTTRDGALVITMDSTDTTQSKITPNSTAPFTLDENHGQKYRSGMLQSWNKFCFTTGYIEVAVTLPGPSETTRGYWPGAWTMGNLGRPGYMATTDGVWPYTYDECDFTTFPNQTYRDLSGPPAALFSSQSRSKNDNRLSWLSGQRLSACTCPNEDHPGPSPNKGRGAPEIDIFEAEIDKAYLTKQVVSQSSQFGPFNADYLYSNGTNGWQNLNPSITRANTFRGSATQQSISALTWLPSDMFQGVQPAPNYATLGFEYWSNPSNRDEGYITWAVAGQPTHHIGMGAIGPDPLPLGSGVGQRLVSEEPMSIVLNLGISANWQEILEETMLFPGEMKFDYVRVYQRKGAINTGCNPKDYPTADYIAAHPEAYSNPNLTAWPYPKPRNGMDHVNRWTLDPSLDDFDNDETQN